MDHPEKREKLSSDMSLVYVIRDKALHYLPTESLLTFRLVCKDWDLEITTQHLADRAISSFFFLKDSNPPRLISANPQPQGVPDPDSLLSFLPEPTTIESSCNGLLCCKVEDGWNISYYICNPATRQWKKLPETHYGFDHLGSVLLHKPPSSPENGPGEYQLICPIPSKTFNGAIEFDVYSSREGTWRPVLTTLYSNNDYNWDSGTYAEGFVYWTNENKILVYNVDMHNAIVIGSVDTRGVLGTLKGQLCRSYVDDESLLKVDVWDPDGTGWEERESVNLERDVIGLPDVRQRVVAVFDDLVVFESGEFGVYLCDLSANGTREGRELAFNHIAMNVKCFGYVNRFVRLEDRDG